MIATVSFTQNIDSMPKSCSKCPFCDLCDGRVAKLTKKDGVEWTRAAVERVSHHCPMKIEQK